MKKITSVIELKNEISLLEKRKKDQAIVLKKEINLAFENLKPANLIKNTFNELKSSPEVRGNILDIAMGYAAGYFSKKVAVGATHNPIKKLLGSILQIGVTKIVTKNSGGIKSAGLDFIKKIFNKNGNQSSKVDE